jgi:hypothetical protein
VSNTEPDWATQLVDTFESAVGSVRAKTSEPATKLVKYAVFAVMALGLLVLLFALLIVMAIRMLNNYLPGGVWGAYLLVGLLFVLAGSVLWRKRRLTQP